MPWWYHIKIPYSLFCGRKSLAGGLEFRVSWQNIPIYIQSSSGMENDGCEFEHDRNHLSTRTAQCAGHVSSFQKPRLGRNWALRLRSAIHRYLELKSNPSTVSATSLRTSSTDHCQEQVDFPPLTSKWRNFHWYGGYERLLFKLPDQMRTAQSIQEGHPSMSGDLCLDRSNKIWGKQSRNRCEKILLLTMKRTSKARRKAR